MSIKMEFEHELNRKWIRSCGGDIIGETNFVVPTDWLVNLFEKYYSNEYGDFEVFEVLYEPENEGEFIYKKAIEDGMLKEDLGVVMYYNNDLRRKFI